MDHVGTQKGDAPLTCADIGKAQCRLGYFPSTSIDQGLQRFAHLFMKEHGSRFVNGKSPGAASS